MVDKVDVVGEDEVLAMDLADVSVFVMDVFVVGIVVFFACFVEMWLRVVWFLIFWNRDWLVRFTVFVWGRRRLMVRGRRLLGIVLIIFWTFGRRSRVVLILMRIFVLLFRVSRVRKLVLTLFVVRLPWKCLIGRVTIRLTSRLVVLGMVVLVGSGRNGTRLGPLDLMIRPILLLSILSLTCGVGRFLLRLVIGLRCLSVMLTIGLLWFPCCGRMFCVVDLVEAVFRVFPTFCCWVSGRG